MPSIDKDARHRAYVNYFQCLFSPFAQCCCFDFYFVVQCGSFRFAVILFGKTRNKNRPLCTIFNKSVWLVWVECKTRNDCTHRKIERHTRTHANRVPQTCQNKITIRFSNWKFFKFNLDENGKIKQHIWQVLSTKTIQLTQKFFKSIGHLITNYFDFCTRSHYLASFLSRILHTVVSISFHFIRLLLLVMQKWIEM